MDIANLVGATLFPEYWKKQGRLKKDLQKELTAKGRFRDYDSMRDSEWNRAQTFATQLLFHNEYPWMPRGLVDYFTKQYQTAQGVQPVIQGLLGQDVKFSRDGGDGKGFGLLEQVNDAVRDYHQNLDGSDYWEDFQDKHYGKRLSYDEIKQLGHAYSQGLLP